MKRALGLFFVLFLFAIGSSQAVAVNVNGFGVGPMASVNHLPPAKSALSQQNLPLTARYAISAALGRDRQPYHFTEYEGVFRGQNPAQNYEMGFSGKGFEVGTGAGRWGLSLSSYGYGQAQRTVRPAQAMVSGNRMEYRRGDLTEWYVNGPYGLQQGFTLESRPQGDRDGGYLRICLDLEGDLTYGIDPDRRGLSVLKGHDQTLYRYTGLTVLDREGREAEAWLEVHGKNLDLVVNDQGLNYPLTIDPVVQSAKLTASDGSEAALFGCSVSVSGDVIVVGAYGDDSFQGAAYVFVKPARGWSTMTQTAKLTASDGEDNDLFGYSVSIDGDVVVAGAYGDSDNGAASGSAYVFVKPEQGWADMTETAKLTASDGLTSDWFGYSVSISGDVIVAGAYGDDLFRGAAYVFVKPVEGWATATETGKLTALDGVANDWFGYSVSISGDVVVAGAIGDDDNGAESGSVYVFVKPGPNWASGNQTAKLKASAGAAGDNLGYCVSISGDVVVAGAIGDDDVNPDTGSVYVFVKPESGWDNGTQTCELTPSDGVTGDYFGYAASISGDQVVVGAYGDDDNGSDSGSAYLFAKPASGWANMTESSKLKPADGTGDNYFGAATAICGDVVVIGALQDEDNGFNSGSAYVFGEKRMAMPPAVRNLLLLD